MPTQPEKRQRLAALMEERRLELDLRWQDVADAGDVSLRALNNVRTGTQDIRPWTRRGIEKGLRWPPGFVARFLSDDEAAVPDESSALRLVPVPSHVIRLFSAEDPDEVITEQVRASGDEMLGYFWNWLLPDGSGLRPRSERIANMNRWLAGAPSGADERSNGTTA